MVRFFSSSFEFSYPWADVSFAFWLRYPNPFASHVLACDVLERYVDPKTGIMHTKRLLLKKGVMPKWARSLKLIPQSTAFIVEESSVDPRTSTMTTRTRNLSHAKLMRVTETQTYRAHFSDPSKTLVETDVQVVSQMGWLSTRVEGFGVKKFKDNALRSREGMSHILTLLRGTNQPFFPSPAAATT